MNENEKMTDEEFAALDKRIADRETKQMDEDDSSILAAFDRGVAKKKAKEATAAAAALNTLPESMRVAAAAYAAAWTDAQRGWYFANLGLGFIDKKGNSTETGIKAGLKPWSYAHNTAEVESGVYLKKTYSKIKSEFERTDGKGKKYVFKTADDVNAVLNHGEYALISAGKNSKNPEHEGKNIQYFRDQHEALRADLIASGLTYTEVKGKYGGVEDSFLVMAHEMTDTEAEAIGAKYGQDSVIHVKAGVQKMIYSSDSKRDDGTVIKKGQVVNGRKYVNSKDATNYYTTITLDNGTEVKYTLNFDQEKDFRPEQRAKGETTFKVKPSEKDINFSAGGKEKGK